MTVTEIAVVLVIALILVGLLAPSLASFFQLEQRQAAKDMALLYGQLHDEAVMRNVTFRIAYDLRGGTYEVQVGEAGVLVFDDPDARERFEEDEARRTEGMDEKELAEHAEKRKPFETLGARYKTKFELPNGTSFGGVYTPQYGKMVGPTDLDEADSGILYSYVFANGRSEHTVVQLVETGDPTEGFTIEIEPLSGTVHLHGELVEWEDSRDFVPSEGPDLSAL